MKDVKPFLKLLKEFFVCRVQGGAGCLDKPLIVKTKIIVFTSIIIPCLLQFPLVSLGQNRANCVNSCLVPVEVSGESIKSNGIIAECREAIGEGGLVGVDSGTQGQIPLQSESTKNPNKRCQDGSKRASVFNKYFDHWWIGFIVWVPLIPLLYGLLELLSECC